MHIINNLEGFGLVDGNEIIGNVSKFVNSKIIFKGKGNVIYVDGNITISDSNIVFHGNDSLLYLSESKTPYLINISIYNKSVVYFGGDTYFNKILTVIASEAKNVIIGSDSLFSYGIVIRNSDAHLIFDIISNERINFSKSVYIGDGVWIGQNCTILKGNVVGSGSIIGSDSVLSNKKVSSHSIWAGNPAKEVRKGVVWDGTCVHSWMSEDSEQNKKCRNARLFKPDDDTIDINVFEKNINSFVKPADKLNFIRSFFINKRNRMFIQ